MTRRLTTLDSRIVLTILVAIQWATITAFALTVRHNDWLYYQGGDESWYFTSAWAVGTGHLPVTTVGWGLPMVYSPIAAIVGPDVLRGLPAIIVLQIGILQPVALVGLYSIGRRLGGKLIGYLAAATWIAGPFAVILIADPRYHERWVEQFMPQLLGLTGLADFPSLVLLILTCALTLSAVQRRTGTHALGAGFAMGLAIGVKPSNALYLIAVVAGLAAARQASLAGRFAVGIAPALVTLLVWKQRGLGELPLFAFQPRLLAAGVESFGPLPDVLGMIGQTYVRFDWGHIDANLVTMREYFWNSRLLEILPFIGLVAVLRRSLAAAALVGLWFWAFFLLKTTSSSSTVDSGSFFRFLMPALPAYVVLIAALPLLVPRVGRRLIECARADETRVPSQEASRGRSARRWALVAGSTAPLALAVALPHLPARAVVNDYGHGIYAPVSGALTANSVVRDGKVSLSWIGSSTSTARTFYSVRRWDSDPLDCAATGGTTNCSFHYGSTNVGTTRETLLVDSPGPGRWWYVVGRSANWLDDATKGDSLLLGLPLAVDVPGTPADDSSG